MKRPKPNQISKNKILVHYTGGFFARDREPAHGQQTGKHFIASLLSADWEQFLNSLKGRNFRMVEFPTLIDLAPVVVEWKRYVNLLMLVESKSASVFCKETGVEIFPEKTSLIHLIELFESAKRELKVTRLRLGQARARGEGRLIGRPRAPPCEEIFTLRASGMTMRAIASRLQISTSTVHEALKIKA